ncbi:MAG: OmpA family protein [Deltaproteobacteria bacterium]|nr:OmpA family protein [Deltaproteobacteria bacterium]
MDPNEPKNPESIKMDGLGSLSEKPRNKKSLYPTGMKNAVNGQSGSAGFMSVPLDRPVSDEVLFAGGMPRAVHWSVAWADVMMTMFVIFAALYIFKTPMDKEVLTRHETQTEYMERDENIPGDAGDSQPDGGQTIQDIYDLSRKTLSSASAVELVPDKAVRIILRSDLLFDLGKAYIKEDAKASLREVAEVLRQTEYMVNVVGHTDDLPINTEEFPSNWELSTARACRVARFLMQDMNIAEEKFYVTGHAYYQPVKPNTDDMNRAANRRVEIIITKERPYGVGQVVQ